MQEADEQTEGNVKKRSAGGELERGEGARALGLCCPLMLRSVNSKELAWASFWDLKLLIFFYL